MTYYCKLEVHFPSPVDNFHGFDVLVICNFITDIVLVSFAFERILCLVFNGPLVHTNTFTF